MPRNRYIEPKRLVAASLVTLVAAGSPSGSANPDGWPHYGGSLRGDRYAASSAINPKTVQALSVAWIYRTGDATDGDGFDGNPSRFRATPILVDGKLVVSTGFNRVYALDPGTGEEHWAFDPDVDFSRPYSEMFVSRGVAAWVDAASPESGAPSESGASVASAASAQGPCATRVFLGTLDARLIALDADTGMACRDFGQGGEVDLSVGIRKYWKTDYSVTSPVTVVGDLVIVGSAVGDNGHAELQPGIVRAYDVRDGAVVWAWDPVPRSHDHPGANTWAKARGNRTGGANVWSVMAADPERDLVFLPTTSPSPDFYGGERLGDNAYANSVVALQASTGAFVWGYQAVRHDLWDYDLAPQPLLFEYTSADGSTRPAIAQATKTGFVHVLDRASGAPLHPVEERVVPQSDVPGEEAARTQPFPKLRLHDTDARPLALWDLSPAHRAGCESLMAGVRYEGIFTPPSVEGTLLYPGNGGGTNWGSMAYDRGARLAYLVVTRLPTIVKLIPRAEFRAAQRRGTLNGARAQHTAQRGTPYGMARFDLLHNGLPCLEGPWSTLVAVDLDAGEVAWERPLGTRSWLPPEDEAANWGDFTSGGPMVTAGGVVFVAMTSDKTLRGFDGKDGSERWVRKLPAAAHSTPMGYRHGDADYVVVTAGGDLASGRGRGDHVIAFRLPASEP